MTSRPPDWDAATYDRVSSPQLDWGLAVLERLGLRGDETVLDAGCGTGRVTAALLERLPRGQVIAVDASPAMVERAREVLKPAGARVDVRVADLVELQLDEPVELVFSTATFHWILDHEVLFARLHDALAPGGRLEAQCGGRGNVQVIVDAIGRLAREEPWASHLADVAHPWRFSGPEEAGSMLRAARFDDVRCWLERRDARPPDMRAFVRSSALPLQLDRLPEGLREPYLDAVMEELGEPDSLPYVRLNISARRPR